MNRKYVRWGLLIVVLPLLAACGGKKGEEEAAQSGKILKFESYTYDMVAQITGDSVEYTPGSSLVRLSGEGVLPSDIGDNDIRLLRDTLMKISGIVYADEYTPGPNLPEGMTVTELNPDTTQACGYVNNMLSATMVNPRVVVFENTRDSYPCMAAHGMSSVSYVNYNVDKGRIVRLGYLFNDDYKGKLLKLIRDRITADKVPLVDGIKSVGISDQFAITSDGLTFSYDPYEIAPYSEGVVTVRIPLGDLMEAGILNDNGRSLLTGSPM